MFVYLDGVIATALSLFVALLLGLYAQLHQDWWVFKNDAPAMTIAIVLTTGLVLGVITAGIACSEHGLPFLPYMALFAAFQAGTVLVYKVVRRVIVPPKLATT